MPRYGAWLSGVKLVYIWHLPIATTVLLSFLAMLPGDWGPRLSSVGFLLLVPLGALALWRAPRTAFGFAASLGMLLLVFFAFSRQGSANYHFAVIGILCAAVAASGIDPEPPARASAPIRA